MDASSGYAYVSPLKWKINGFKGILRDFCVHFNYELPTYSVNSVGPPHDLIFECSITLTIPNLILNVNSKAKTKKQAEVDCAQQICMKLNQLKLLYIEEFEQYLNASALPQIDIPPSSQTISKEIEPSSNQFGIPFSFENAKEILQHSYQVETKKLPQYQITSSGNPIKFIATVRLDFFSDVLSSTIFHGEGSSKKEAEKKAAYEACLALSQIGKLSVPISYKRPKLSHNQRIPPATSQNTLFDNSPSSPALPKNLSFKIVCGFCKQFLCYPQDLYFGKHITILNSTVKQALAKSIIKDSTNLRKKFILHCPNCNHPLGSIIDNEKGGDRNCFGRDSILVEQYNSTDSTTLHLKLQEFLQQSPPSVDLSFVVSSDTIIDLSTILKPIQATDVLYIYRIFFKSSLETEELDYMEKHVFDGFELYSPIQLIIPDFSAIRYKNRLDKRNSIPVSLKFIKKCQLPKNKFSLLEKFHRFFFSNFLKQNENGNRNENSILMNSFFSIPYFKHPSNFELALDDEEFINKMMTGVPSYPILNQLRSEFSFEELRKFCEEEKETEEMEQSGNPIIDLTINPELNEKMKKCVDEISRFFFKRPFLTTYNNLVYFISEVTFSVSINEILEFYKNREPIKDLTQPLFISNLQTILKNKKEDDYIPLQSNDEMEVIDLGYGKTVNIIPSTHKIEHPKFIPEVCNLVPLTFQMYEFGQYLPSIFLHIGSTLKTYKQLELWQSAVGISIKDILLLKQVFTHPSYAYTKEINLTNYERLEFLGDAVAEFIVTLKLYKTCPAFNENSLVMKRTDLLSNKHFARIVHHLKMDKLIITSGVSELKFENLGDFFEALMGALFLDQGLDTANKVGRKLIFDHKEERKRYSNDVEKEDFESVISSNHFFHSNDNAYKGNFLRYFQAIEEDINNSKWQELEEILGYKFRNKQLLEIAFTHKSYCGEPSKNYEQLEWFGDSILKLITSIYVFYKFPEASEYELTRRRTLFVMNQTLCKVAFSLGLNKYLKHKLPSTVFGDKENKVYADIVEALIAVIYFDKGFAFETKNSISHVHDIYGSFIYKWIIQPYEGRVYKDSKSLFINLISSIYKVQPSFLVTQPKKGFYCARIYLHNNEIAEGYGTSEKKAENAASENAIELFLNNKI